MEAAIATVVKVEGSSYRQPGARMLVTADGRITGAISGGCLEGDALRKALLAIDQKTKKLVTYDTSEESDQAMTIQLGCNGKVHILFEYINDRDLLNPVRMLEQLIAERKNAVVVTLFSVRQRDRQPGTSLLLRDNSRFIKEEEDLAFEWLPHAGDVLQAQQTRVVTLGQTEALIEFIPPPVRLVVVGAGNDAMPVVKAARLMGWDVIVADGRTTHATAARFPEADEIWVGEASLLTAHVPADDRTLFALMTHNYRYDLTVLEAVLQTPVPYIGVLGPKTKLHRMYDDLAAKGIVLSSDETDRIYGPIGLEIGAETSEDIAVSAVAEMKAVLSGKPGTSLRNRTEKIHSGFVA